MPDPVETTDPEGIDFAWVMQTTFVLTILLGAPILALASIPVSLPSWGARASFAIRVGAIIWIVVAIGAFFYERHSAARRATGDSAERESAGDEDRTLSRGDGETRTPGGHRDDHGGRDDRDDRENTERPDGSARSISQSASSESRSDT